MNGEQQARSGAGAGRSRPRLGSWPFRGVLELVAAAAVCSAACAPVSASLPPTPALAPARVAMPGPAPRDRNADSASALNATCAGCHQDIAAEWRASFHARSQHDNAYQRAFALEPLPFCQGCHAPEADAFLPVSAAAADLGVGCVTCHVVGEHVLAATTADNGAKAFPAPHALTRTSEFAGVSACASCHEFAFPDVAPRGQADLMQATLREHEHSASRAVACASCHMPSVGEGPARHRSHAFPGGHDADFVKAALAVRAERCKSDRVCLVLATSGVGHAFPTGDLFRRLEVSAEAIGSDEQVVGSARRYLSRHWSDERKPGAVVRSVTRDDRAFDAPTRVELELTGPVRSLPVAWRVAYQRVEHPRSELEQDSVVGGEIEIASGTLAPIAEAEENHAKP